MTGRDNNASDSGIDEDEEYHDYLEDIETAFGSEESIPGAANITDTMVAAPANEQISPENDEYWDAVNDTYKKKKNDNEIPNVGAGEEDTNEVQELDSSMGTSSALASELDPWEYWDPISDSYKKKNPSISTSNRNKERGFSEPNLDSDIKESHEDSEAGCWEYWDPISDSYKRKKPSRDASDKDEERRSSEPIPDSSGKESNGNSAVECWEYWDPTSDSYKRKKTSRDASDKDEERRNSEPIPDSIAKGSNEDSAVECWEYWDPTSDSYKRKRTGRNASDKDEERRNSEPIPDSSAKRSNGDSAVEC